MGKTPITLVESVNFLNLKICKTYQASDQIITFKSRSITRVLDSSRVLIWWRDLCVVDFRNRSFSLTKHRSCSTGLIIDSAYQSVVHEPTHDYVSVPVDLWFSSSGVDIVSCPKHVWSNLITSAVLAEWLFVKLHLHTNQLAYFCG